MTNGRAKLRGLEFPSDVRSAARSEIRITQARRIGLGGRLTRFELFAEGGLVKWNDSEIPKMNLAGPMYWRGRMGK